MYKVLHMNFSLHFFLFFCMREKERCGGGGRNGDATVELKYRESTSHSVQVYHM